MIVYITLDTRAATVTSTGVITYKLSKAISKKILRVSLVSCHHIRPAGQNEIQIELTGLEGKTRCMMSQVIAGSINPLVERPFITFTVFCNATVQTQPFTWYPNPQSYELVDQQFVLSEITTSMFDLNRAPWDTVANPIITVFAFELPDN